MVSCYTDAVKLMLDYTDVVVIGSCCSVSPTCTCSQTCTSIATSESGCLCRTAAAAASADFCEISRYSSPTTHAQPSQRNCRQVPTWPTQPSIHEYLQLRLGSHRQVWFFPLADERGVCRYVRYIENACHT